MDFLFFKAIETEQPPPHTVGIKRENDGTTMTLTINIVVLLHIISLSLTYCLSCLCNLCFYRGIIFISAVPRIKKRKEEVKNYSNNSQLHIELKYKDNDGEKKEDKAHVLRWLKVSINGHDKIASLV